MIASFGRLLAITVSVLILSFLALFFVRQMSLRASYSPPPHPWFNLAVWNVAVPTPQQPCVTEVPGPDWIILERVSPNKDGFWQSACGRPLLERLGSTPHRNWLLQVDRADNHALDELVKVLNAFDREKSFAIYAPSQQNARYLRKQGPQWIFAADQAALVRLHLFSNLWLEPVMEFWPDFVLATGDPKDGSRLSERERQELERRKKKYVVLAP